MCGWLESFWHSRYSVSRLFREESSKIAEEFGFFEAKEAFIEVV
jgi:hypothetical protein